MESNFFPYTSRPNREFIMRFKNFETIKGEFTNNDLPIIATLHQNLQLMQMLAEDSDENLMASISIGNTLKYSLHWYPGPKFYTLRKHHKKNLEFIASNDYYSKHKKNQQYIKLTSSPLLMTVDCIRINMVTSDLLAISHLQDGVWRERYQFVVPDRVSPPMRTNPCNEVAMT